MRPRRLALAAAAALLTAVPTVAGAQAFGACDADDLTLVSTVQGDGFTSPLDGQEVTIEAAVTGVYPELEGITVQEEPADVDDDPATSEGVFVDLGSATAVAGFERSDIVQVTGTVEESFGHTEIAGDAAVCNVAQVKVAPTPLRLPAEDAEREALEGMLVVTTQDLTVTGLFSAYRFGELGVSSSGILREPTAVHEPGSPAALALAEQNADDLLHIDDRGEFGNDNDPWFGEPGERAGDIVAAGVEGVLVFSFGDYKIEPVDEFPEIVAGDPAFASRAPAPDLGAGNDIGAFNVLNYFNTFGDSAVLRGARSPEQFELQSAKIVDAILDLDTAVLGLVELENDYEDRFDGDPSTEPSIQTLVGQLNAVAGAGTYDWIRIPEALLTPDGLGGGGLGTDAIAVGIIYQPDRATPVGKPATFDIDALLGGEDPDNNRWPLAHSFEIDGEVVTVVVNHFKSKGSTCDDTVVPNGFGDGQDDPQTGSCDLVREYAAERLLEWVRTKPTQVQSPDTFVVGDLNAYPEEDPIEIFLDAGYLDVMERHDDTFTFKFDGRYGRLDYILASPSAKRLVDDAAVWHANAPEPYGYLYFNEPIDATAYASSDHDPVVTAVSSPGRRGR